MTIAYNSDTFNYHVIRTAFYKANAAKAGSAPLEAANSGQRSPRKRRLRPFEALVLPDRRDGQQRLIIQPPKLTVFQRRRAQG